MASADPNRRVYHISPWRRSALWWALGPFLLLGIGFCFSNDEGSRTAGIVLIAIMGTMLALWQWLVSRTRLELSPEGVMLWQLGMKLQAPWNAIAALRGDRGREGFVTSVPLAGGGAERLAAVSGFRTYGTPLYSDEQRALMREHRWIPLEAFGWHLRKGKLAADIAAFAPQLTPSFEPTRAPAKPPSRRSFAALVAFVGALLTLTVVLALGPPERAEWFFAIALAVCSPLAVASTAWSARNCFRSRSWFLGTLFVLSTAIAFCWCILTWSQVGKLLHA